LFGLADPLKNSDIRVGVAKAESKPLSDQLIVGCVIDTFMSGPRSGASGVRAACASADRPSAYHARTLRS